MTSPRVTGFVLDQYESGVDTTPNSPPEAPRNRLRTMLADENSEAASVPRRRHSSSRRTRNSSAPRRRSSRKDTELSKRDETRRSSNARAEIQIMELREQMVALKVRNRDLEEELKSVKAKFRKEREAMMGFEDTHVDIQHDLAETKRISSRLEKENDLLRKKVAKREEMNQRLLAQLEKLRGGSGDESSFAMLSNNSVGTDDLESVRPPTSQLTKEQRSSIWKLLADEAIPQSHSPVRSMDSNGNLLEQFFRSSHSLSSFTADMSKSVSSASLSPKNRLQRSSRMHSRVGMSAA